MTSAWTDLGGVRETYEQALARSLVGQPAPGMNEQELAAKLIADRERMRRLDHLLRDDYIPVSEQVIVSRALARQLGYMPHDNSLADDSGGWAGTDD